MSQQVRPAGRPTGLRSEMHGTLQWLEHQEATPRWGSGREPTVGDAFRAEAEVLGRYFNDDAVAPRRLPVHQLPAAGVRSFEEVPPAPRPALALRRTATPTPPPVPIARADTPTEYARAYRWEAPLMRTVAAQTPPPPPPPPPPPHTEASLTVSLPTSRSEYSRQFAWQPTQSPFVRPEPRSTDTLLAHHVDVGVTQHSTYDRTFKWPYTPPPPSGGELRHDAATETEPSSVWPAPPLPMAVRWAPESSYCSAFRPSSARTDDVPAAGLPTRLAVSHTYGDGASGGAGDADRLAMVLAARVAQRTTHHQLAFKDPGGYVFVRDGDAGRWVYGSAGVGSVPPAPAPDRPAHSEYADAYATGGPCMPPPLPSSSWLAALADTRAAASTYRARNERTEHALAWRARTDAQTALLARAERRRPTEPRLRAPYAEDSAALHIAQGSGNDVSHLRDPWGRAPFQTDKERDERHLDEGNNVDDSVPNRRGSHDLAHATLQRARQRLDARQRSSDAEHADGGDASSDAEHAERVEYD